MPLFELLARGLADSEDVTPSIGQCASRSKERITSSGVPCTAAIGQQRPVGLVTPKQPLTRCQEPLSDATLRVLLVFDTVRG